MKNLLRTLAVLAALAPGCGAPPGSVEKKEAALVRPVFQTVPGHNTAVESDVYSCNGWSYRMMFSLEQHQDPASPTGWYGAVGPSSPSATGTVAVVTSAVAVELLGAVHVGL